MLVSDMLNLCYKTKLDEAFPILENLHKLGYSAEDIISVVFRICKNHPELPEFIKLEFIKVSYCEAYYYK